MKKLTLISLLIFQFAFVNAQPYYPFPDSNAVWSFVLCDICQIGPCIPPCYTYYYAIKDDTTINSINYYKLYYTMDSSMINWVYYGSLREDSLKRIYYMSINDTNELLLYDFSKNVGDTIFYDFGGFDIIFDIDSVLLMSNQYRKSFLMTFGNVVIEGIGNVTRDLLYQYSEVMPQLLCFKQNDTFFIMNDSNCYYYRDGVYLGIDKNLSKKVNYRLFPNPISDNSVLKFNNLKNKPFTFKVYDLLGIKVNEINNIQTNEIYFNKKQYKKGFYLFRLIDKNGKTILGKFIIR